MLILKARYVLGTSLVIVRYGRPGHAQWISGTGEHGYRYVAITRDLQGCGSTFMYGKTLPSLAVNPELSLSAYCTNDGGRLTNGPSLDYKVGLQEGSEEGAGSIHCPVLDSEKFAGSNTWMIYDLAA